MYFPAPSLFDEADYMSDSVLFGEATWFNRAQLDNDLLINMFVIDGWLPDGVLVGVVHSWCWRFQFACYDEGLFI